MSAAERGQLRGVFDALGGLSLPRYGEAPCLHFLFIDASAC